nr:hypothetical protein CFP56_31585 [Quercus suber]
MFVKIVHGTRAIDMNVWGMRLCILYVRLGTCRVPSGEQGVVRSGEEPSYGGAEIRKSLSLGKVVLKSSSTTTGTLQIPHATLQTRSLADVGGRIESCGIDTSMSRRNRRTLVACLARL